MQGLNPITMQCIYSTPCGYCTKWDKKCDKKIGCDDPKSQRGLRAQTNVYDDIIQARLEYNLLKQMQKDGMSYIARDKDGLVVFSSRKPFRGDDSWKIQSGAHIDSRLELARLDEAFSFLSWTNEPMRITELLSQYT